MQPTEQPDWCAALRHGNWVPSSCCDTGWGPAWGAYRHVMASAAVCRAGVLVRSAAPILQTLLHRPCCPASCPPAPLPCRVCAPQACKRWPAQTWQSSSTCASAHARRGPVPGSCSSTPTLTPSARTRHWSAHAATQRWQPQAVWGQQAAARAPLLALSMAASTAAWRVGPSLAPRPP